jgi:crotonobetainyl-CoA:carnitine CoA-transferase CaiB-like acyl-CoA transferase
MLLALHGAEVIKVEPLSGDWGRAIGRAWGDHSAHSVAFNRGKRSLALDMKSEAGRAVAHRLAGQADIVVESFRPGVMARFGLGYEELAAARPELVYCSVSGYGQTGPYRDRKVSDAIMQAFSGLMTVNRDDAGMPRRIGMIAIDVLTGLYAFQAVSSAMLARFRYGRGALIDCSMLKSAAAFQAAKLIEHVLEDGRPQDLVAMAGTFPTADGFLNVSAVRESHYVAVCEALERPDLITDPRFAEREERLRRTAELRGIVAEVFRARPTREWSERLAARDVPHAAVSDYDVFLADPHVDESRTLARIALDGIGEVPFVNLPGLPETAPGTPVAHAPHIGEHSRGILEGAGYGAAEIERLVEDGVVGV